MSAWSLVSGLIVAASFWMAPAGLVAQEARPDDDNALGHINPDAPPEAQQFEFLVGYHDCEEEVRNPADGKWYRFSGTWDGRYILNGHAVQDGGEFSWRDHAGTNIRIYNPDKGLWTVSWFKMPGNASGVWEGGKEGDKMVMRQKTANGISRLTFYNISEEGFDWISEIVPEEGEPEVNWKIFCERVAAR